MGYLLASQKNLVFWAKFNNFFSKILQLHEEKKSFYFPKLEAL